MYQILYAALEAGLAALILLPVLLILNKIRFHSMKTTALYFLFCVYLCGVYAVVGLPNVTYIRFEPNVNLIPFADLLSSLSGTLLNIVLFIPLGLFLTLLWKRFGSVKQTLLFGFCLSLAIELLQMFTFRATDINDLITNTLGTLCGFCLGTLLRRQISSLALEHNVSDLPILVGSAAAVMFFFQPLFWNLIY